MHLILYVFTTTHIYAVICIYIYRYKSVYTQFHLYRFTHTHTYIYIYRYTWYPPVPTFELPLLVFTGLLTGLNVWSLAVVSRGVPYVYINIHIYCNLPKSTEDHISLIFPVF